MINNIKLFPIPEKDWWREPEKKKLTALPKQNWRFNIEKGRFEKKDVAWPWFGLIENPEIRLFISESTGMIAFESSQEDNILMLLLQSFFTTEEIVFDIEIPEDIWRLEYLGENQICNRSQRSLPPNSDIIYDWIALDNDTINPVVFEFIKEGEKENLVSAPGSYKFTYLPTGYSITFDIDINSEYSVKIDIGLPEKASPTTPSSLVKKKLSLIEVLTIPSTILWKKLTNSLSKKQ